MIPRATYRLQFRNEFSFADAVAVLPYLARLGISHIYSSPILAARPGSPHGYDVIDHARINPELGGESGFQQLAAAARRHGLGIILDIVPNHMAVGVGNRWWADVLARGRHSVFAPYFDIDWEPPDTTLRGKVLIPILGSPLSDTLAKGEIAVVVSETGEPIVRYSEHRFPLRSEDLGCLSAGVPQGEALAALLERQHYRLAWWRTAGDLVNWRRFFDINHLVALRMEDDHVFEAVHALPLALFGEGLVDGFRIDHVDGLADPGAYCRKLRARMSMLRPERGYLVVEKILAPGETLQSDWAADGTTGYDFMNDASALMHDPAAAEPLARAWSAIGGRTADFQAEERNARRELLSSKFNGAFVASLRAFWRLAPAQAQDMTKASLRRALLSLLCELRVYRTYSTDTPRSPAPREFFDAAVSRALRRAPANDRAAMALIVRTMQTGEGGMGESARTARRLFNQLAASLAAKAGEDTAYYRYGRLLSRSEVGADPDEFSIGPKVFHARAAARCGSAPLLATATHDHKRGADARMRLAVLSEIPAEWMGMVSAWLAMNAVIRDPELDIADEYQLYQTLVAAWPPDLVPGDITGMAAFAKRIEAWWLKSLHEEKLHTSWSNPDRSYEEASTDFVRRLLATGHSRDFLESLSGFVERIAPAAAMNSLVQCVLHCTTPGVPDFFQGTEYWDLSLVDPDNRRTVDFGVRAGTLHTNSKPAATLAHWRDGRVKQALIANLLSLRKQYEPVFAEGSYEPIEVGGAQAAHALAFARSTGGTAILVGAARLCAGPCMQAASPLPSHDFWQETAVRLPPGLSSRNWSNWLGEEEWAAGTRELRCAALFKRLPVFVFVAN